jgi:hypothetical protein
MRRPRLQFGGYGIVARDDLSSPVWPPSSRSPSPRPVRDAGVCGSGMAPAAITIALRGGVTITGGIRRVRVVLATLLIVWLNASILLANVGNNEGAQYQLLALGSVLVFAALLNGLTTRRYGGTR